MGKHRKEPEQPEGKRIKQVCYVCKQTITGVPVYIGKELYRHQRCEPGMQRWLDAQAARPKKERSTMLSYYLTTKEE